MKSFHKWRIVWSTALTAVALLGGAAFFFSDEVGAEETHCRLGRSSACYIEKAVQEALSVPDGEEGRTVLLSELKSIARLAGLKEQATRLLAAIPLEEQQIFNVKERDEYSRRLDMVYLAAQQPYRVLEYSVRSSEGNDIKKYAEDGISFLMANRSIMDWVNIHVIDIYGIDIISRFSLNYYSQSNATMRAALRDFVTLLEKTGGLTARGNPAVYSDTLEHRFWFIQSAVAMGEKDIARTLIQTMDPGDVGSSAISPTDIAVTDLDDFAITGTASTLSEDSALDVGKSILPHFSALLAQIRFEQGDRARASRYLRFAEALFNPHGPSGIGAGGLARVALLYHRMGMVDHAERLLQKTDGLLEISGHDKREYVKKYVIAVLITMGQDDRARRLIETETAFLQLQADTEAAAKKNCRRPKEFYSNLSSSFIAHLYVLKGAETANPILTCLSAYDLSNAWREIYRVQLDRGETVSDMDAWLQAVPESEHANLLREIAEMHAARLQFDTAAARIEALMKRANERENVLRSIDWRTLVRLATLMQMPSLAERLAVFAEAAVAAAKTPWARAVGYRELAMIYADYIEGGIRFVPRETVLPAR